MGGSGGSTNLTTFHDPESALRAEKATPAEFEEGLDEDERRQRREEMGSRTSLKIPKYGSGSGPSTGASY
tara:strand:- start:1771 stop:1980 length:210 start_codon:yes stop_codon:yes gene_type:complete